MLQKFKSKKSVLAALILDCGRKPPDTYELTLDVPDDSVDVDPGETPPNMSVHVDSKWMTEQLGPRHHQEQLKGRYYVLDGQRDYAVDRDAFERDYEIDLTTPEHVDPQ